MIYFDAGYLVRLYLRDQGFQAVRDLASKHRVVSSRHGRTEMIAALHRATREARFDLVERTELIVQVDLDYRNHCIGMLALTESVFRCAEHCLANAPITTFLRAADALHLACAAEHGFTEVYSNDRHFLAAAHLFGLRGINVIP